ncbi:MAG: metal-dependent transcriptional regulator [Erysipelotrichaceae bacterium]|nr:metal-dependent transcriptional regulator [Erysipelotrichaceae bacterium]
MTKNQEDYIKLIHELYLRHGKVTNKMISEHFNIKASSVSEMLRKLKKEGFIEIIDNEILLTKVGLALSKDLISKHRLWEFFLVKHLGFSWQEVHAQAELLEHATTPLLKERLNAFLSHPKTCPHGAIIYENANEITYAALNSKSIKEKLTIMAVSDEEEILDFMDQHDLHLQDALEIIDINRNEDVYIIVVKGKEIQVPTSIARLIYVES